MFLAWLFLIITEVIKVLTKWVYRLRSDFLRDLKRKSWSLERLKSWFTKIASWDFTKIIIIYSAHTDLNICASVNWHWLSIDMIILS